MNDTPPDFNDRFDENDNVKATPQAEPSPPAPIQTNLITNTQSGAEFNVFFKNSAGYKCHLKLHGASGRDVLETAAGALAYLAANNFVPEHSTAATPTQPTRENLPADGTASKTWCTIHECEMSKHEKHGDVWYSHKIAGTENDWCRGPK